MAPPDPCQKPACDLQVCLQRSQYQEARCVEAIARLVACCDLWGDKSTKVCPGIQYYRKVNSTLQDAPK